MTAPRSAARARCWALALGVALPLGLLGLLELGLRAFGPPPSPVLIELPATEAGEARWTREAGLLERGGVPEAHADRIVFSARKPAGATRIFVVGESTAAGFPLYPFLSFGRVLEGRLAPLLEGPVEVVNLGKAADPSERVRDVALEALRFEADLLVVYAGHNDFQWPYVEALRAGLPGRWRAALGRSRIARLFGPRSAGEPAPRGESMAPRPPEGRRVGDRPFVDEAVRRRGVQRYREHLEQILDAAAEAAVPVILCTQTSNLRDFAPNYSSYGVLPPSQREDHEGRLGELLRALEDTGAVRVAEAAERAGALTSLVEEDPGVALSHWLRGRWLERARRGPEALDSLRRARDLDGYPSRAPGEFNAVVRELAARDGVWLLEAEGLFEKSSRHAAPGDDLFLDHCHPTVEATFLLGEELLGVVLEVLAAQGRWRGSPPARIDFLAEGAVEPWLEAMGLSRAELATRTTSAGSAVLLSFLQSPGPTEVLDLALLSFDEALEVDPGNARAWAGRCAALVLQGRKAEALEASARLEQCTGSEGTLDLLSSSETFQQALHRIDLKLEMGRLRPTENDP